MKNIKLTFACLLMSFSLIKASAQDAVPVRNEPHHKVVLENDYVRLIEVHIKPNDTTLTHIHAAPSVIVFLSRSTIGTQIVGDAAVSASVNPGQTSYAAYDEKAIKHRVWNAGDSMFHVMDIEMVKKDASADSCAVLSLPGASLQIQKNLVRVYNLDIAAGKKYTITKSTCAHLLIEISGFVSSSNNRSLKPGMFAFYAPQSSFEITGGKENSRCVLLEMK